MPTISEKVRHRIENGIKKFQGILGEKKAKDVNESDTVMILIDMLKELFGYDASNSEITSEYKVKNDKCDLAVKINDAIQFLIEAKAIGIELKEAHIKQAVDYSAHSSQPWVVLTNGIDWQIYEVIVKNSIATELVVEFDFSELDHKNEKDIETVFLLCNEGWKKSALDEFQEQRKAMSRFFLGALIVRDPFVKLLRKELKMISPDVKIDLEELRTVLETEVIKREILDDPRATTARRAITRAENRLRGTAGNEDTDSPNSQPKNESVSMPIAIVVNDLLPKNSD